MSGTFAHLLGALLVLAMQGAFWMQPAVAEGLAACLLEVAAAALAAFAAAAALVAALVAWVVLAVRSARRVTCPAAAAR